MTAALADFYDEGAARSLAEVYAEGEALAAPPPPWGLTENFLGPTVEVRKCRPFADNPPLANAVWAVVDREKARERLVTPAPLTDPALLNRDESAEQ